MQQSNFSGARQSLERAYVLLDGKDEFSVQARVALGLLIDGCASKEFAKTASADNVVRFPSGTERDPLIGPITNDARQENGLAGAPSVSPVMRRDSTFFE